MTTQWRAVGTQGVAPQCAPTDLYIAKGPVGRTDLSAGCWTWHETLALVAADLTRNGEVESARVRLKARLQTVRAFLQARYGIFTGPREYWHRENWTPDRADLRDFLRACQRALQASRT
jgi:hypothetical protein